MGNGSQFLKAAIDKKAMSACLCSFPIVRTPFIHSDSVTRLLAVSYP